MVGEGALGRPSFDGPPGQPGGAPRDDACPRSARRPPGDLPQVGARWAAVPCETAPELCAARTGRSWRAQTARGAERAVGQTWRPVVGWAIEGACVPTRPEAAQGAGAGRRHPRAGG